MPTSADRAGAAVPSTTVPPLSTRSCTADLLLEPERHLPGSYTGRSDRRMDAGGEHQVLPCHPDALEQPRPGRWNGHHAADDVRQPDERLGVEQTCPHRP